MKNQLPIELEEFQNNIDRLPDILAACKVQERSLLATIAIGLASFNLPVLVVLEIFRELYSALYIEQESDWHVSKMGRWEICKLVKQSVVGSE